MKINPARGPLKAPADSGFGSGTLVTYENEGSLLLAGALGFRGGKLVVLNERGKEVELPASRLHALPSAWPLNLETTQARCAFLSELHARCMEKADKLNLEELWMVVVENQRGYMVKDLCELLFNKVDLEAYLSLRIALIQDRIYFKRDKDLFSPRPPTTVEELHKAEQARISREEQRLRLLQWMQERIHNPALDIPKEAKPALELLEDLACAKSHLDNQQQREGKALIDRCAETLRVPLSGTCEQRAYDILEAIHYFKPWTNMALIRHRPPLDFSDSVLIDAQDLDIHAIAAQKDQIKRTDFTALACFTIDDPSTLDMDDAISLERLPSGDYRLGIHISDVASFIRPGSILDKEAKRRSTSIYLPELIIPMLPAALSENKFSLVAEEVRACVSCLFEVDRQLNVGAGQIVPSLIRVGRRYSYEQVEDLLDQHEPHLTTLYNILVNCEMARLARGAMKITKRDLSISLEEEGRVSIAPYDEHSPARAMVGEAMILANSLLASFCAENRLAAAFRSQEAPEKVVNLEAVPVGPARDYAERSQLKKSQVSLEPRPHAGLGLECYIQATSPIRRYLDLCNQRQIMTFLQEGRGFYDEASFSQILMETEESLSTALAVSRDTKRFWLLQYLRQSMRDKPSQPYVIEGTVLRSDLKNPLVELEEVYLPVLVRFNRAVKPGERVRLKITNIDPQRDFVRFEETT